jgi:type III restriction enzyme
MSIAGSSESDFLVRLRSGDMFVLETKGQGTAEEEVKHQYMKEWIMAVNAHGGFAFGGSATPWRDS